MTYAALRAYWRYFLHEFFGHHWPVLFERVQAGPYCRICGEDLTDA